MYISSRAVLIEILYNIFVKKDIGSLKFFERGEKSASVAFFWINLDFEKNYAIIFRQEEDL